MPRFTEVEYTEYMLANRYLGYSEIAFIMAATLFEKAIMKKIEPFRGQYIRDKNIKDFNLNNAINLYMETELWRSDPLHVSSGLEKNRIRHQLHLYRRFRNEIAHAGTQDFSNESYRVRKTDYYPAENILLNDFLEYIYDLFAEKELGRNFFKQSANKTLLQDYKLKEINERMISELDSSLNAESKSYVNFFGLRDYDYENLFKLRAQLVFLQKFIKENIPKNTVEPTILSPIDTTSAYIWMPFVDKNFIEHSDIIETQRHNLVMGSASILVTPLDLRIYIDFGGGDIDFRLRYQEFLLSEDFKIHIDRFKKIETPLKIFTTKWYSFIENEPKNILDIVDSPCFKEDIEDAKAFLNIEKEKENIITSGQNLLGFILPSTQELPKEFVLELFKEIIHLYYEFIVFKYPEKKEELRDKQNNLFTEEENITTNNSMEKFNLDIYNQEEETHISSDDYYN